MEMNHTFNVIARCRKLDEITAKDESYNDEEITLTLNKADAMKFLFKFTPFIFELSDGKQVVMKVDNYKCTVTTMVIIDKENEISYVVTNPQMLWTDILEAYEQLRLYDKIEILSSIHVPDPDIEEEE